MDLVDPVDLVDLVQGPKTTEVRLFFFVFESISVSVFVFVRDIKISYV